LGPGNFAVLVGFPTRWIFGEYRNGTGFDRRSEQPIDGFIPFGPMVASCYAIKESETAGLPPPLTEISADVARPKRVCSRTERPRGGITVERSFLDIKQEYSHISLLLQCE
jgi:hypothetical protein